MVGIVLWLQKPPPFKFWSSADHFRHLIPAPDFRILCSDRVGLCPYPHVFFYYTFHVVCYCSLWFSVLGSFIQSSTLILCLITTNLFIWNSCVWYACFLPSILLALHVWHAPYPFTWDALKGTGFPVHAVKACRGIIAIIYNLGTRWMWVAIFTFLLIGPLERTVVPIE